MPSVKQLVLGAVAATGLVCTCIEPAAAGVHGAFHPHGFGLGRGIVGAVVALATLPIAIASALVTAGEPAAPPYQPPAYGGGSYGYAPPAASYAPPPAYYARAPAYYAPPRVYYAPRPSYYGGYGGYRPARYGYAYPHR
jgi:hypothetical protein